jgi:hypothetical protein
VSGLHRNAEPGDSALVSTTDTLGQHDKLPVLAKSYWARSVASAMTDGRTVSLLLPGVPKPADSVPRKERGIPPRPKGLELPGARPVRLTGREDVADGTMAFHFETPEGFQ